MLSLKNDVMVKPYNKKREFKILENQANFLKEKEKERMERMNSEVKVIDTDKEIIQEDLENEGDSLNDDYAKYLVDDEDLRVVDVEKTKMSSLNVISKEDVELLENENVDITGNIPKDYSQFKKMLEKKTANEINVMLLGLETINFNNKKKKLQTLFKHLFEMFFEFCKIDKMERKEKLGKVNTIGKHLGVLIHQMGKFTSVFIKNELIRIKNEIFSDNDVNLKNEHLVFFQLISNLYPTSDRIHPIVTPMHLIFNKILENCFMFEKEKSSFLNKLEEIKNFVVVMRILLQNIIDSKKFFPCIIPQLELLCDWIENNSEEISKYEVNTKEMNEKCKISNFLLGWENEKKKKNILSFSIMELIRNFSNIYKSLSSYPELFSVVLEKLEKMKIKGAYGKLIEELKENIKNNLEESQKRVPISLMKKDKPDEISSFEPSF